MRPTTHFHGVEPEAEIKQDLPQQVKNKTASLPIAAMLSGKAGDAYKKHKKLLKT